MPEPRSNLAALRTDPKLQAKVDRLIRETKPQAVYEAFAFSNHMNKRDGFEGQESADAKQP